MPSFRFVTLIIRRIFVLALFLSALNLLHFFLLQRENREKCREADQLKRLVQRMKDDLDMCRSALEERDRLIQVNKHAC